MSICAYLAPVYMSVRTEEALQNDFRHKGMIAGLVLGILTAVEIPVAMDEAPLFASRFLAAGNVPFVAMSVFSGITTLILLWRCRFL